MILLRRGIIHFAKIQVTVSIFDSYRREEVFQKKGGSLMLIHCCLICERAFYVSYVQSKMQKDLKRCNNLEQIFVTWLMSILPAYFNFVSKNYCSFLEDYRRVLSPWHRNSCEKMWVLFLVSRKGLTVGNGGIREGSARPPIPTGCPVSNSSFGSSLCLIWANLSSTSPLLFCWAFASAIACASSLISLFWVKVSSLFWFESILHLKGAGLIV